MRSFKRDMKKTDGSILNRLRRFQNKSSPKLPVKDYHGKTYLHDSDTYEFPQEEKDDSYEPPPCQRVFPSTSSASFPRGEYIDSCRNRPGSPSPRKPVWPPKTTKPSPSLPPKPNQQDYDEEDYVNPESDDEDNYINPTEESPANTLMSTYNPHVNLPSDRLMHGRGKPITSSPSMSKTVPERSNSPGMRLHLSRGTEYLELTYFICVNLLYVISVLLAGSSASGQKPLPALPKPMPRETYVSLTKIIYHIFCTALATRHINQKLTATPQPSEYKCAKGTVPTDEKRLTDAEEGTDVLKKPWYASTCDRKTAEDALVRSNKDGSFLIRKSSGQDTQQPYTLVVFYNSRVYNIPVRYIQASQRYALGREKKGEERFTSVSHIIENHQRNPLVLIDSQSNSKDSTKLCYAVNP
uniref:SH2 domain-containing protein n=1 Tax=Oncorhynchus mykiss TaxID=8022 RepID=A0A8C7V072_ONCMY